MVNMILGAWWWECKYKSAEVEGASDGEKVAEVRSPARSGKHEHELCMGYLLESSHHLSH